jgi:release factor glutamine methyltransferase
VTIARALQAASGAIGDGAASLDALDAALLLGHALTATTGGAGVNRATLLAHSSDTVPPEALAAYEGYLKRRAAGECVAYIVGHREFRRLDLLVTRDTLVPRPETETLVEAALECLDDAGAEATVLDLCTGTGAVALALKMERPALDVCASDISEAALAVARRNGTAICGTTGGTTNGATGLPVNFVQSDLFSRISGRFDLITANPPYVPSGLIDGLAPEVRLEPRLALDGGPDGLALLRAIISGAPSHLHGGGSSGSQCRLLLEASPEQMPALRASLEAAGFAGIRLWRDLSGRERVIGGRLHAAIHA